MKKSILCSVFLCVFVFSALKAEEHATGARLPTPEEQKIMDTTFKKIIKVRPNALWYERVNERRAAKGMPALNPAASAIQLPELETVVGASAPVTAAAESLPAANPDVVDNSKKKWFPPIGNQGSLGSCACFSTVYYMMTYETAKVLGTDAAAGSYKNIYSPKWMYNFMNGGAIMGGSSDGGNLSFINTQGVCTWEDFPYDADFLAWCLDPAVWKRALANRIDTPMTMSNVSASNFDAIKTYLANGHIVTFDTLIGSWVEGVGGNDPAGTDDDYYIGKTIAFAQTGVLNHSMTCVGYDDNAWIDINGNGTVEPDEKGVFKIANSWGAGDGYSGFRYFAYDAIRPTSTVCTTVVGRSQIWWGETVYAMTATPNYKPKLTAQFTISTVSRKEVALTMGTSATTATTPVSVYQTFMWHGGGDFALDGTTPVTNKPMDGTFYLDMTRTLPVDPAYQRYYLCVNDNTAGNPTTIKSYKVNNAYNSTDVPLTVDGQSWSTYGLLYLDIGYGVYPPAGPDVFKDVKTYPQPFNPVTATSLYKLINLPLNAELTIYTIDGKQVRHLKEVDMSDSNAGWIGWDGRDDAGDIVGRGIYMYSIQDAAGNKKTGKIAIVK